MDYNITPAFAGSASSGGALSSPFNVIDYGTKPTPSSTAVYIAIAAVIGLVLVLIFGRAK